MFNHPARKALIFVLLSMGWAAQALAGVYFIHADHLGTPRVVSDQVGTVVWKADYDAFGKATLTTNVYALNLRFPGQYFDAETNLHYNYFRDYDPSVGRYLQSDPIGLEGGLNAYAYVGNNPIRFMDPLGLWKVSATFGGQLLFGVWGGQKDSGFGFDSAGNVCVVVNNCDSDTKIGVVGGVVGLGGTVGAEKGEYCEGESSSKFNQLIVEFGGGLGGGLSVETDDNGYPVGGGRAFGGVTAGTAAGDLHCETRTICRKIF